ncbi:MAG: winged helix-turn-helix domain-containing protein [Terracidiphilus sp.]|nr:winged helix-turn-helix domain-containing protein [Terracidiphilus sp.]
MFLRVFEFGDFKVDCDRFELSRAGRALKLERKPLELLILLAAGNGHLITRTEIIESLWDSEVFVDTEHGINTAIRKIRQVLGDDPERPRFVQTVTGKGYRFIAPIATVDPSLSGNQSRLSPTEANPLEVGGAAAAPMPTTASPTQSQTVLNASQHSETALGNARISRIILWLAAFGAVVVLAFIAISPAAGGLAARFLGLSARPQISSLAVLPLDNLSGDPSQDYFADGMTDELITMLAKNSTLRVVSRTSVMQYKGAHRPLPEIARALGVDGILEGSIARSGDKVHMTIQLIQAPSDTHLWAESYDRDTGDIDSLSNEAAKTIAKRLNSAVSVSTSQRYVNPAAHDAYLHGRYLWFASLNAKSFEYFKKATELQPDYAPGWSGLALYYGASAIDGQKSPAETLEAGEEAARKAVQLDDTLPEAHLVLCAMIFVNRWDWTRSDLECKRAIELDPEYSEAYHFRAKMLAALNRNQEAIEAQKKATELDPFARPWALDYSYQLARQYDAAQTDGLQRLDSTPNDWGLHWILYETYRCKGMYKEATRELEKMLTLQGEEASVAIVRRAFQQGGYNAVIRWQLGDLKKKSTSQYVSPVDLSLLYAQLGDREKTLSLLEQGYREHSPLLLWVQNDPAYDFLHSDGRYRLVIRDMGLPPAY